MERAQAQEVIDCLPEGRTPFWYFRDRYALLLLAMLGDGVTKADLRHSAFRQLLDKAVVKSVFAAHRGRAAPRGAFEKAVFDSPENYSLGLTTWGDKNDAWSQTTRRGCSLVLQLNFPATHNVMYRRLVDPEGKMPFACSSHPVARKRDITFAWSRIDVDLPRGEALVEEIQTDWLRDSRCWNCSRRAERS